MARTIHDRLGGSEKPSPMEPDRLSPEEKRRWILDHLQCPECGADDLSVADTALACSACGTRYGLSSKGAPVMFTEAIRDRFNIHDTENVSAMGYDADALALIDEVRSNGGFVLDAGAGSKSQVFGHVVDLEIVDYESTDVLGVGQRLPFRDSCFDAVLSIAVLEHVDDPFQCAAELVRVLKPGGRLLVAVPFLQPEHGYPEHYFNMTRSGLRRLFKDKGQVLRQFIPGVSHPLYALNWFLQVYAANLPGRERQKFESLTVGELLGRPPEQWVHDPVGDALPEHARWILACGTALELKK